MKSYGVGKTDVGQKRDHNEDCFYVDDELSLYIVSDGMGGHAAGEVASRTAVDAVVRSVKAQQEVIARYRRQEATRAELARVGEQAVLQACREVFNLATSGSGRAGMGCTLTMALVAGSEAAMAHVGDSRLYLCRAGIANQLSNDHTVAAELRRAGILEDDELGLRGYRHALTRTVGTQPAVRVDTLVVDVLPDDVLVLCSDGLSGYLDSPERLTGLLSQTTFDSAAELLVRHAYQAGGNDNITAVTVRIAAEDTDEAQIRLLAERVTRRLDVLSSVFLFEDLPLAQLTLVLNACALRKIPAGDTVLSEGDLCDGLFIVAEGAFSLTRGGAPVGELGSGDYTAMATLLRPRPARATLRARIDSRLLHLNRARFYWLLHRRPQLGVDLLERLARKLSEDLDRSNLRRDDGDPSTTPLSPTERL